MLSNRKVTTPEEDKSKTCKEPAASAGRVVDTAYLKLLQFEATSEKREPSPLHFQRVVLKHSITLVRDYRGI